MKLEGDSGKAAFSFKLTGGSISKSSNDYLGFFRLDESEYYLIRIRNYLKRI
jgi:hypothetical protein